MKNENLEYKLDTLKEIIKRMNSSTIELINLCAQKEIRIKSCPKGETSKLEHELDELISQYSKQIPWK